MKKIMMGCLAAVAALIAFASCSQDFTTYSGPSHIMFSDTLYQYAVQESNEVFNVPVSATEKADYDRTFGVEVVDKQSNAIEGKHYRILNNTVTIKAGEMVGNVKVQGIYDNIGKTDSLFLAPTTDLKKLIEDEFTLIPSGVNIRLWFPKEISQKAVITGMARALDIDFSIVGGKLERYIDDVRGFLIINVEREHLERVSRYLEEHQLFWEVMGHED